MVFSYRRYYECADCESRRILWKVSFYGEGTRTYDEFMDGERDFEYEIYDLEPEEPIQCRDCGSENLKEVKEF